jgi:hypothetical protein
MKQHVLIFTCTIGFFSLFTWTHGAEVQPTIDTRAPHEYKFEKDLAPQNQKQDSPLTAQIRLDDQQNQEYLTSNFPCENAYEVLYALSPTKDMPTYLLLKNALKAKAEQLTEFGLKGLSKRTDLKKARRILFGFFFYSLIVEEVFNSRT